MDIIMQTIGYLALIVVGMGIVLVGALSESAPVYIGGFVVAFGSAGYGIYSLTSSVIVAIIIGAGAVVGVYCFLFGRR